MTLKQRHKIATEELMKIAKPILDVKQNNEILNKIAKKVGVSDMTVLNYSYGRCKDGFLTEAITDEFKKLNL